MNHNHRPLRTSASVIRNAVQVLTLVLDSAPPLTRSIHLDRQEAEALLRSLGVALSLRDAEILTGDGAPS